GYDTIKATVYRDATDEECRELSVRDNEMHGDLSQIEKALQCFELKEEEGWSVQRLCDSFNTSKSTVYNWLKVAELDDLTLGLIHHGYLNVYHGLELSKIEDDSRRLETAKFAVGMDWSVRQIKKWREENTFRSRAEPGGWIDNCWKDLARKGMEECKECEHFEGTEKPWELHDGSDSGRDPDYAIVRKDRLKCSAPAEVDQPETIERFLREASGWEGTKTRLIKLKPHPLIYFECGECGEGFWVLERLGGVAFCPRCFEREGMMEVVERGSEEKVKFTEKGLNLLRRWFDVGETLAGVEFSKPEESEG
ncbi:hypothetical protein AKJ37_07490, partial [candidate division MSBL1 archaeon SCGC-AAA259I09]